MQRDQLKDLLHREGLTRRDQLLIVLACEGTPKKVAETKKLAAEGGLRSAKNWNVSLELTRTRGLAANTPAGWVLTSDGKRHVDKLIGAPEARLASVAASLRKHLEGVASPDVKGFLEEAVSCYEHTFYRAAIVLSWVGAVAILHNYVFTTKLTEFNTEATRRLANSRNPWVPARRQEDLGRMSENDLLQVLDDIRVITKNEKQLLEQALRLRNSCGHPTSVSISANVAAAHIETLMLNVYTKF